MKATGIVRRVDDLGRIVIPKEIRRTLKIREGDPSADNIDTNRQIYIWHVKTRRKIEFYIENDIIKKIKAFGGANNMSLRLFKLRIMAKKIMRKKFKYAYRNVIGYFVGTDGIGAVFVSKDNSVAPKKGTFLEVFKEDKIYDIQTGEEVSAEDIFGKTFFDDDPTLLVDNLTPEGMSLEDKIDILFDSTQQLASNLLESRAAFVMANDFFEEEEENMQCTYQRFVILYNYLKQRTQKIDTEEFAYMHHELMTI